MRETQEFHYRLPRRVRGHRPGSHPGLTIGAGQEFVSHVSLYDRPDPRRLDLRASLRSLSGDWLIRVNRQRAGVSVYAVVDVSPSMTFGALRPKQDIVADFLESLGLSAFRAGDALGMLAFDTRERTELFVPARVSRGTGSFLSGTVRQNGATASAPRGVGGYDGASGVNGLEQAAMRIAGREGLVFIASDFHWPLARLGAVLDLLSHAFVVPLVIWDRAEIQPPAQNGFAMLRDVESGSQRTVWLRPRLRSRWHEAVARRRKELDGIFATRDIRPIYLQGEFDAQVLSKYFLEAYA